MRLVLILALCSSAALAQPAAQFYTRLQSDNRFVHKTGDTMTGALAISGAGLTQTGSTFSLGNGCWSLAAGTLNFGCALQGSTNQNLTMGANGAVTAPSGAFSSGLNATAAFKATGTGYVQLTGVATGSLPTAGAGTRGSVHYDSTVGRLVVSDPRTGSDAWRYVLTNDLATTVTIEETFTAMNRTVPSPEATTYLGTWKNQGNVAASSFAIACNWASAGVVGGATTGVVMAIVNAAGGAELCSCTIAAAASCGLTNLSGANCLCNGTIGTGVTAGVQMKNTTDCGTDPGDVVCTVNISKVLNSSMSP